ncbi:MAG: glutathione peroxidase [Thermoleophilia bacterium]
MTRRALALLVALAAVLAAAGCAGGDDPGAAVPDPATRGAPVLPASIELIDGARLPASRLEGRVVLVVNTASRCGFAPQFADLEALSAARSGDGLTVIGFPSDDFAQELDAAADIAAFCELNYGVRFPMAAPGRVTGPGAQPLFRAMAARGGATGREPDWNFTKYVLDRRGRLVARFPSSVGPDDPRLTGVVDRLLAEPGDV